MGHAVASATATSIKPIAVYRGPYEYSVPGADKDFTPQTEPPQADKPPRAGARSDALAHAH